MILLPKSVTVQAYLSRPSFINGTARASRPTEIGSDACGASLDSRACVARSVAPAAR